MQVWGMRALLLQLKQLKYAPMLAPARTSYSAGFTAVSSSLSNLSATVSTGWPQQTPARRLRGLRAIRSLRPLSAFLSSARAFFVCFLACFLAR